MRVYVSVDIEGVAGVVNNEDTNPGHPEWERARRLMTAEASAVVAGIFDADPSAQVTVADGHAWYRNLVPEELDERATLMRGKPRVFAMVHGVERGYDQAMLVGVHGRAGAGAAVLSHTFTGALADVQVNGRSLGELGLNAALAGAHGVSVTLVAGDQTVEQEAYDLLGDAVITVRTKESLGFLVAESLHPAAARAKLRDAAARAVRERPAVAPFAVESPVDVTVHLASPVHADLAELIENVERVDGRSVRFTRADLPSAYRVLRLIATLSTAPQ
jgi:D-amino peptidase